jgi:hypothetical protein
LPTRAKLALPELLITTVTGVMLAPSAMVPKFTLVGDIPTLADAKVPVSEIDCGEFPASSVITRDAVRCPPALGAKVTLMLQLPVNRDCRP